MDKVHHINSQMKRGIKTVVMAMLLLVSTLSVAAQQKNFFYVRLDPSQGNVSAIVEEIDRAARRNPDGLVVMFSGGNHPRVESGLMNWERLRETMLITQSAPEFYADVESTVLDSLFAVLLGERVKEDNESLRIDGVNDEQWIMTFILPRLSWGSQYEYEVVPLEAIAVGQLEERSVELRLMSYGEGDTLTDERKPRHQMFEF